MQSLRGIAIDRRLSATSRRESSGFSRVSRKVAAKAAITERRKKYEAAMLEDKHLLKILSVVYRPKSQTDSMALLKGVRMSQEAPYQYRRLRTTSMSSKRQSSGLAAQSTD